MFHPYLRDELARATHEERLREAAEHRRAAAVAPAGLFARLADRFRALLTSGHRQLDPQVELRVRPASAEEAVVLDRLPARPGGPAPTGMVLMAEVDGATAAALFLDAHMSKSAASPSPHELHELLRLLARQLLKVDPEQIPPGEWHSPDVPRPTRRFTRRRARVRARPRAR